MKREKNLSKRKAKAFRITNPLIGVSESMGPYEHTVYFTLVRAGKQQIQAKKNSH